MRISNHGAFLKDLQLTQIFKEKLITIVGTVSTFL